MKVRFTKDVELSYDGINSKVYKKGEEYEPNHAQEKKVFEHHVSTGLATLDKEEPKTVKTKVTKPRQTKKK
jgi:hypothetical protein